MRDADESFGVSYLQARISAEFPLALHIGISVERADDGGLELIAPFAPNANFKGTAFGGSLFSIAVLAGWAWVTRYLATKRIAADAVIQKSTIHYLAPVHGVLKATLLSPSAGNVEKFQKMMQRAGRGRLWLGVEIRQGAVLATRFEGIFAATRR
jgi:thioesterase domain-containing protein